MSVCQRFERRWGERLVGQEAQAQMAALCVAGCPSRHSGANQQERPGKQRLGTRRGLRKLNLRSAGCLGADLLDSRRWSGRGGPNRQPWVDLARHGAVPLEPAATRWRRVDWFGSSDGHASLFSLFVSLMENRGLAERRRHRHRRRGRVPIGACVAATALAALGCATTSTPSAAQDEGPPPAAEAPPSNPGPNPGQVPNDDIVGDAARSCARVGDGLKPRLVAERELGRADFGNRWVRYTFQCEPNDETPED